MNSASSKQCYACTKSATTKEHAPPFSFFPAGQRTNLITVPSCPEHNNDNSKDVEYARNVISTMFGVNAIGQQLFADKSIRSFDRSPALLYKTFADIRPVQLQGSTVGAFTVDTARITNVIRACITAVHFRETGERASDWEIILPNLAFQGDVPAEQSSAWYGFLSLFGQMPFQVQTTSSPEVFEFAIAEIPGGRIYSLRFYKGFLVFAFRRMTDGGGSQ
jgi:hypothetical protein